MRTDPPDEIYEYEAGEVMDALKINHEWNVTPLQAEAIQSQLAGLVVREDALTRPVQRVAGVDVAYDTQGDRVIAGIVILDIESMETIENKTAVGSTQFPYTPGLFAFRELPALLSAFREIENWPHLVICDGQGIAHPRRLGMASHLGLLLDVPTIGCGKSRHIGDFQEPAAKRGASSALCCGTEIIGRVLRTQDGIKPLFVSIGHRVCLETAESWVLRLANQYRQPEPIRRANELVNSVRERSK